MLALTLFVPLFVAGLAQAQAYIMTSSTTKTTYMTTTKIGPEPANNTPKTETIYNTYYVTMPEEPVAYATPTVAPPASTYEVPEPIVASTSSKVYTPVPEPTTMSTVEYSTPTDDAPALPASTDSTYISPPAIHTPKPQPPPPPSVPIYPTGTAPAVIEPSYSTYSYYSSTPETRTKPSPLYPAGTASAVIEPSYLASSYYYYSNPETHTKPSSPSSYYGYPPRPVQTGSAIPSGVAPSNGTVPVPPTATPIKPGLPPQQLDSSAGRMGAPALLVFGGVVAAFFL